ANLRPELYAGIVAEVPFVDVITTMSDPSLPLTTLEYEEWGNPAVKREYHYMLSYSPYDHVVRKNYPAMYVSAAFYDSQVSYAEPAKWVARLRASKTDPRDLLLRTDMDAGHQGRSGRGGSTSQNAEIIGWLIAHAREPILQKCDPFGETSNPNERPLATTHENNAMRAELSIWWCTRWSIHLPQGAVRGMGTFAGILERAR